MNTKRAEVGKAAPRKALTSHLKDLIKRSLGLFAKKKEERPTKVRASTVIKDSIKSKDGRKTKTSRSHPQRKAQGEGIATDSAPLDFAWIDTAEKLSLLAAEIQLQAKSQRPRSYIDTEADSLYHYAEQLCLIQLACNDRYFLIDPLSVPNIPELLSALDLTEIWLHGADYDLTLLKRTYGWSPHRIYDTQIAARLCGCRSFGLAALVQQHCGITLCKSSQKADWSQRPLPSKMQAYAVDDVRYLGQLADKFMGQLTASGRIAWFEQSCSALRSDVRKRPDKDREDAWRISGSGRLKPQGLAALRELWLWRDAMAAERDVPPFKIFNNQQLLTFATDYEANGRVAYPPRWRATWRDGFRAAFDRAKGTAPQDLPQQPRQKRRLISENQKARIEELCALREAQAQLLGLEGSLIGSRAAIEELVLQPESASGTTLLKWQLDLLGLASDPEPTVAEAL